jgi:hypothetical protein
MLMTPSTSRTGAHIYQGWKEASCCVSAQPERRATRDVQALAGFLTIRLARYGSASVDVKCILRSTAMMRDRKRNRSVQRERSREAAFHPGRKVVAAGIVPAHGAMPK